MTRDEAVDSSPVDLAIWEFDNAIKGTEADDSVYPNYCIHIDEYKTALKALLWMKSKQPDPNTGLLPCGCGGKPEVENIQYDGDNWRVTCKECQTAAFETVRESDGYWGGEESAKENWNRAMGYRDA